MNTLNVGDWVTLTEDGLERERLIDVLLKEIKKNHTKSHTMRDLEQLKKPKQIHTVSHVKIGGMPVLYTEDAEITEMHLENGYYRKATDAEINRLKLENLFKERGSSGV